MAGERTGSEAPHEDLVNRSGFPFQLAVERVIQEANASGSHPWEVAAREFPWSAGFVDIVLELGALIALIECKRVKDGEAWIFLSPEALAKNIGRCRLEWWNGNAPALDRPGISKVFATEFNMCEGSPEADFCIIPRKQSATPSIERMTQELLSATHDIAVSGDLHRKAGYQVFIPAIVTNTKLMVCAYRANQIDIATGTINGGNYEEAPFVRFRKTLVARRSDDYRTYPVSLADMARDRQRTVFIVNATHLNLFLSGFRSFTTIDRQPAPPEYMYPDRILRREGPP